jgi:hypothetical protein
VDEIVVRMNLQVAPRHPFISRLPFVLPRDRAYRASSALIGLANIVQKGHAADDVMRRHHEVRVNLGIDP